MNLFRWTAVAGILIGIGACGDAVAPETSTRVGDIQLTLSASAAEVNRGAPVTFQVKLVNEGSEAATLHFSDSCQIVPTIRNSLGEYVLPTGGWWGCLTVLTQLTLVPGQPVVRDYVWTGSTEFQSEMPLLPLSPGKYFFTAKVPAAEATLTVTTQITLK